MISDFEVGNYLESKNFEINSQQAYVFESI